MERLKAEVVGSTEEATNETPGIGIEDFMKIDLRVGQILSCEPVPKSKKLLKLEVDLGDSKRQILAGLALAYSPEEMLGKRVVVVANLKPAKLMGLESQGMLLAASPDDGTVPPRLVAVSDGVPLGSRVR